MAGAVSGLGGCEDARIVDRARAATVPKQFILVPRTARANERKENERESERDKGQHHDHVLCACLGGDCVAGRRVEAERADIGGGGGGTLPIVAVVPACGATAVRCRPRDVGGSD